MTGAHKLSLKESLTLGSLSYATALLEMIHAERYQEM
jgi:hypothetical protein